MESQTGIDWILGKGSGGDEESIASHIFKEPAVRTGEEVAFVGEDSKGLCMHLKLMQLSEQVHQWGGVQWIFYMGVSKLLPRGCGGRDVPASFGFHGAPPMFRPFRAPDFMGA